MLAFKKGEKILIDRSVVSEHEFLLYGRIG